MGWTIAKDCMPAEIVFGVDIMWTSCGIQRDNLLSKSINPALNRALFDESVPNSVMNKRGACLHLHLFENARTVGINSGNTQ